MSRGLRKAADDPRQLRMFRDGAIDPAAEKPCKKCGVPKPLAEFYADRKASDGRRSSCIECDKARKRTDEVRAQSRRYYHSEKGKAAERRYIESGKKTLSVDKELRARRWRKYRESGAMKAWLAKYHRTEKARETLRRKRQRPYYKAWRKAYYYKPGNHERFKAYYRRKVAERESLKGSLPATLTAAEWQAALAYFDHRCVYCGAAGGLDQEHFIPVSRGGPYTRGNIVPSCGACNSSKKNRPPERWCRPEAYARVMAYFASLG